MGLCGNQTAVDLLRVHVVGEGANWDELIDCQPLPLSIIFLLAFLACWALFFVISAVRRLKHSLSATRNMVVAKKMQHFQFWGYSFFYTMTYLSTVFALISLAMDGFYIAVILLAVFMLYATAAVSQVDVVGDPKRKPGVNEVSLSVMAQYLLTTYLPKAVWKTSGHKEFDRSEGTTDGSKSKSLSTKMSKACCFSTMDNHITPLVYDVKDVAAMQGAFQSLPLLFVILLTYIRTTNFPKGDETFDFNVMTEVATGFAVVSAILPPVLGDWERYAKDDKMSKFKAAIFSAFSIVKRGLELSGRVLMYSFLVGETKFAGFALLAVEWFVMYATYIPSRDASAAGRTGSTSHLILTSLESTFYGFYRRITVDKEYVKHNNGMSATIELLRYVFKTLCTVAGYAVLFSLTDFNDFDTLQRQLIFAGIGANMLMIFIEIAEFVVVRRSELNRGEVSRLVGYWKSWYICSKTCCRPTVVHLNRDDDRMGGINYV